MERGDESSYTRRMTSREETLARLLATYSVFHRPRKPFVLSSGKTSAFYFDCRRTTMLPEAMPLIGRLVFERIRGAVDAVGGLTMGADPIACAVAYYSQDWVSRSPRSRCARTRRCMACSAGSRAPRGPNHGWRWWR